MLSIWKEFLNFVFPPKPECPFCGGAVPGGRVCSRCAEIIEGFKSQSYCCRCGRFAGKGAVFLKGRADQKCSECGKRDWPFVIARAAGPYEGILKDAVHRFKYAGQLGLAEHLAVLMAEAVAREPLFEDIDVIMPVPLSGEKLRQRRFNQAALLAKEVGEMLRIKVDARSLVKVVDTPPQAALPRPARESNVREAFALTNTGAVSGRNVLIIDDVFTTGSTMSAAAAVLAGSGANKVYGVTAAAGRYL